MIGNQVFRMAVVATAMAAGLPMAATAAQLSNTSAAASTATFTVLHRFNGPGVLASANTVSLIRGNDGNLYGITQVAGSGKDGVLFQLTPTGVESVLYTFHAATDGGYPESVIQGRDGNFYGESLSVGGSGNGGSVFKLTADGHLTTLHTFSGSADGSEPAALVEGSDGNFYGVTSWGGTGGGGTVFRLTPQGDETVLHAFDLTGAGTVPSGLVEGTDGNFYGTTFAGPNGSDGGTVFRVTPGGDFTNLHTFSAATGDWGPGGLIRAQDGNFYGTLIPGGTPGDHGCVYRITPEGDYSVLHQFTGGADGGDPTGLIQGRDGNFYGAEEGQSGARGGVYELTPTGKLTVLYAFDKGFIGNPSVLVQGDDGQFFGVAESSRLTSSGLDKINGLVYSLITQSP